MSQTQPPPPAAGYRLDQLLHHISGNTGLYSQQTFLNLFACFVRLLRDHKLQGTVLTLTQSQPDFQLATLALQSCEDITQLPLESLVDISAEGPPLWSPGLGLLVVLTDRLSAFLHWNTQTEPTFRLLQGGWSFHPGDTKTLALQLVDLFQQDKLSQAVAGATTDRRYDEKLTLIVNSLVGNLEARNRDLTLALARETQLNEKVLEHERMAAIGQLCSVIAHEIRNPLGLIDLYATLAKTQLATSGQVVDEKVIAHLNQISSATQHLETILTELTQYSRPMTLIPEPLDIVGFTEQVLAFIQPGYEQKGVVLGLETSLSPDTPPQLSVDPNRLRQALINLLKNALEATPAGHRVTLTLSHRQGDPSLYIKVTDQGAGVEESHQDKLFTPYFSTKGSEGTGLGLAHVRKIMQAHGGNAQLLWSTPGEGSCFALILPLGSETLLAEGTP